MIQPILGLMIGLLFICDPFGRYATCAKGAEDEVISESTLCMGNRAQRLIMHGFEMMRAVSPSLNKSVFDLLHQDEKRLCKNPNPRHMPDDRCLSHQQQRTNKSHVVEQNQRGLRPEEWPRAGMQALSPAHSPYGATNAQNQVRSQAALESRGSKAAS